MSHLPQAPCAQRVSLPRSDLRGRAFRWCICCAAVCKRAHDRTQTCAAGQPAPAHLSQRLLALAARPAGSGRGGQGAHALLAGARRLATVWPGRLGSAPAKGQLPVMGPRRGRGGRGAGQALSLQRLELLVVQAAATHSSGDGRAAVPPSSSRLPQGSANTEWSLGFAGYDAARTPGTAASTTQEYSKTE